jgi:hypothetical protein
MDVPNRAHMDVAQNEVAAKRRHTDASVTKLLVRDARNAENKVNA